jgi:tyrosine-protein kinase Etk/Wzc
MIIIDSPPVLAATDAAIIARSAGITLMVVRYAQTHLREIELSLDRLSQIGMKVEGIVFNDVQSAVGYGYKYAYQYQTSKQD